MGVRLLLFRFFFFFFFSFFFFFFFCMLERNDTKNFQVVDSIHSSFRVHLIDFLTTIQQKSQILRKISEKSLFHKQFKIFPKQLKKFSSNIEACACLKSILSYNQLQTTNLQVCTQLNFDNITDHIQGIQRGWNYQILLIRFSVFLIISHLTMWIFFQFTTELFLHFLQTAVFGIFFQIHEKFSQFFPFTPYFSPTTNF
eukprot:TRINITY_DN43672_c1_g1_i2.p2 TRINITY_DN43672_c1_g1~~TRINITY_DN43672_c1_g1_i2.p2  ORF type:complete len:199 (+),score=4.78 TRINITY_DN43672_c1_g1_i2:54-650(+)